MAAAIRPGPIYARISEKLTVALRPSSLRLRDDTHLHASHAQSPGLPETHFNVEIISDAFEGMSLVQRQRRVYEILSEELKERIHALAMTTRTVAEQSRAEARHNSRE